MRRVVFYFFAVVTLTGGCGGTATKSSTLSGTTSAGSAERSTTSLAPVQTKTLESAPPQAASDPLEDGYLIDEASDQAYWQRAVERLSEQDDVKLDSVGDVSLTMTHNGETAKLTRDDLGSIAYNSCSELADKIAPAKTVGWIKEAFDVPRRWEAAELRLAALETKCPTLNK